MQGIAPGFIRQALGDRQRQLQAQRASRARPSALRAPRPARAGGRAGGRGRGRAGSRRRACGRRSASPAPRAARPARRRLRADSHTRSRSPTPSPTVSRRGCAPSTRSILLNTSNCGIVAGADFGQHFVHLAARARSRRGSAASTTCSSRSASRASDSVDRNAATRSCGRSRTKPTVSESASGAGRTVHAPYGGVEGREQTGPPPAPPSPVRALNRVDLPALV